MAQTSLYVFCFAQKEENQPPLPPPAFYHPWGPLQTVVRTLETPSLPPTKENLLFHEKVVRASMADGPVLPIRFGQSFPNAEKLESFLLKNSKIIRIALDKLRDKLELGLKIYWTETGIQQEVENEPIRKLKARAKNLKGPILREAALELGQLVQAAMERKKAACIPLIYDHLARLSVTAGENAVEDPNLLFDLAFLLESKNRSIFTAKVNDLATRYAKIFRFSLTGPWPPYNFTSWALPNGPLGEFE